MDDVLPTAKWANRMLRPLTSIYHRLEKHHETLAIVAAESSRSRSKTPEADATTTIQPLPTVESLSASGSDADEDDPVWIPGKKLEQRRVKHKYSARGRAQAGKRRTRISIQSPEATRTLPGAIQLATPVITGKRWEPPSSTKPKVHPAARAMGRRSSTTVYRDRYSLQRSPWQELLDQSDDPGFADIVRNFDRVWQNFLNNTRLSNTHNGEGVQKRGKGARSLLSMVMRRLPDFIAREQEAQMEEDEVEEDMCDAYFTELESYYAPHGKGWKPLREAVRAQGIYLVSSMIQENWITDPIAYALIEKCQESDPDACESLLSKFLSMRTSYPLPLSLKPPIESGPSGDSVKLLRKYANYEIAQRSYIFDELSKLLMRGVLPPEWVATKWWNNWMARATVSFSRANSDSAAASKLMEAVLLSASGSMPNIGLSQQVELTPPPATRTTRAASTTSNSRSDNGRICPVYVEDALSNHVISLLAALCGMHISRSRSDDEREEVEADGTKAGQLIGFLSFQLEEMENKSTSSITALTSQQLLRRSCITLAHCLVQCNDALLSEDDEMVLKSSPGLEKCSKAVASRPELVKELALFVKQAFRCFGEGSDDVGGGERDTREMISKLPHMANEESIGLSKLWGLVAVDAAMQFAETTGEPDHHVWAMEIQENVNEIQDRAGSVSVSDCEDQPEDQPSQRGLYRWEESIGEWVARTPGPKTGQVSPHKRDGVFFAPRGLPRVPCVRCSTDSVSPQSDRFEYSVSSSNSSPSSVGIGAKRNFQEEACSPTRPAKRRREAPVIVVKKDEDMSSGSQSASSKSRSPSLEPVPSGRRILRDMSNRSRGQAMVSTAIKPSTKIEVVIINQRKTEADENAIQPAPEVARKEIHRTVERRRRPGRPPISRIPTNTAREPPRRRSVIPCSQDDSDDELSFI